MHGTMAMCFCKLIKQRIIYICYVSSICNLRLILFNSIRFLLGSNLLAEFFFLSVASAIAANEVRHEVQNIYNRLFRFLLIIINIFLIGAYILSKVIIP